MFAFKKLKTQKQYTFTSIRTPNSAADALEIRKYNECTKVEQKSVEKCIECTSCTPNAVI